MKIIFIGTVLFSYRSLEKLISMNSEIVGVITKKNSSFNSDFKDLTPLCNKHNITIRYTQDINSNEDLSWIKKQNPDIIFCFGWSSLIKKPLLQLAPMGIIGFHPAKLPQNRGRHPLIWALALGLQESATTFFFMDEGADSGDILSQKSFLIDTEDDAQSLYNKVIDTALQEIESFVPALQTSTHTRRIQDNLKANYWRKRGKKDGFIDFRMSQKAIYNLVRALTHPYIGANIIYKDVEIKIWKVEIVEGNSYENIESGKIIDIEKKNIYVKCYDGVIKIVIHEFKTLPNRGEYL